MKTLTLITSLFLTVSINAQIFAPTEAVWYYTYDPDITLDDGYQKIEIVGDSIINNRTCKILQKTNIGYNYMDNEYYEIVDGRVGIYEEDSVVYYNKGNQFYILYNFSAKKGETYNSISYQENCNHEFSVTIDSITSIENDGNILKKFNCTIKDSVDSYHTFFIERVGYPNYLLPSFQIGCEQVTGPHYPEPLRCYSDNVIGEYSTSVVSSCNYITSVTRNQISEKIVSITPNPIRSQENIQIEILDTKVKTISVYNLLGEKVLAYSINNEINKIITISKPSIYVICFTDGENRILDREKIIVK